MAISLESADANELIPQSERCLNCGAELSGEYCNQCGQKKVHRHDFSIRHFFGHLLHEFTHLDSNKILKTLYALVFRPGLLTAEYLAGRKGSYINPIRIYLTFSALYFLFAWGALYDVRGGGAARMAKNQRAIAMARQRGIEPIALGEKIQQKAEKYAAGLRFGSVLISGLFLSVLFIGTRRYYVEHLIFSLHYYSFDFFCKTIFAVAFIVASALGLKLPSLVLDLFYPVAFIYLMFALHRVYRQRWAITGMKAVVLFVCETLLFIAVNMAGFIIAFSRV
ncbi:MAG TPA: DUF3667 domain-containing protein [Pyrinomonadaceae bacterium]|nr:DUF3667 domain-containing protein [Pyrinomonadaceae bacterium]